MFELGGIWATIVELVINEIFGALIGWLLESVFGIPGAE